MMNECVGTIDEVSSPLTTTVTNETTNTSDTSESDGTKSRETTTLDNYRNEKDNSLMKKLPPKSSRPHYIIIDGKKIRSALSSERTKKHRRFDENNRRVSFPTNDKELVTGYLEPANPWEHAEDVSRDILISSYKESCERHCTEPLKKVLDQLQTLDIHNDRCEELSLNHEPLERKHCEPLEEILKRVQFRKIDLESSGLTDESAEILFDMVEYYESAKHVNISRNGNIGTRGWQACSQMIKKTLCLEQLDAKSIVLTQQHMNILKRPLQLVSHLQILKVENCGLAGRAFVILVTALKLNTGLKELYLADNNLEQQDAIQLGSLLRTNTCLQLLDISNNNIKDEGVRNILDGLISQSSDDDNDGGDEGLKILILWNNHLSKNSAEYFVKALAQSKTLETLNIGQNGLSDDFLEICKEALKHNTVLLQLGVQATGLMNKGIMALAEIVGKNTTLQRIDLRDNHIQLTGLTFLSLAMKRNVTITQIDLDEKAFSKAVISKASLMEQYAVTVAEIRACCARNDEPISTDSSTEESGSPQHRSRLSSVNSRKISLTCQTLPRTSSVQSSTCDLNVRNTTMLEPKRTTGGRLRSPAPSPIPSPVASPIPSPSRSRFVVCRVSEASLSSTNSSASSSPITPPSLASSPTCFFPTTAVGSSSSSPSSTSSTLSSRFRVTVVEPKDLPPIKKINNVVTSANTNVTIGFNYRTDMPDRIDSDDSDSVFKSETDEDSRLGSESSVDADASIDEHIVTPDSGTVFDIDKTVTPLTRFSYNNSVNLPDKNETPKAQDNIILPDKCDYKIADDNIKLNTISDELPPPIGVEILDDLNFEENLKIDDINEIEMDTPPKITTEVPKQSSLERLLGLFQHPGSLFAGTFTDKSELPLKNSLQGSVNSMMALGDKFHQYLRETTGHIPLQRSVSDAAKSSVINKNDPIKSHSIDQLSSIDTNYTNINQDNTSYRTDEFDDLQIPRRLSGVEEVDGELDNPKLFNMNNDNVNNTAQNNENLIDFTVDDDNGETFVPVLTYKSEYSIILSDSDNVIDSTMMMDKVNYDSTHLCVNKLCDNGTKDSINDCNLSDASVFPIVDYNLIDSNISLDNFHNPDNVHNYEINSTNNIDYTDSTRSNDNDDNCELNLPIIDNFIVNHNQGNDNSNAQYVTIEEEVKELLASILNVIPLMINDETDNTCVNNDIDEKSINNVASNDFIDFAVNNDEKSIDNVFNNSPNYDNTNLELNVNISDVLCENIIDKDINLMHDHINDIVHELTITNEDNIMLKVSNIIKEKPILADNMISSVEINCQNLTSSSSSIIDDYDNQQTSRSPTNLFIDKSTNIHRNSQDSGIEEANVSISDDNYEISPQPRDSLQESLDSGIDSECSSVCTRIEMMNSFKDHNTVDKFNDIPVVNANESQCINSKNLLLKATVFVNDDDEIDVRDDIGMRSDAMMIDENVMTIIGAKTSQEEHIVSTNTSLE